MNHANEDTLARLERLEACQRLGVAADEALEIASRDRLALEQTLSTMLPLLATHTGARWTWIHTYDEDLVERDFHYGKDLEFDFSSIITRTKDGDRIHRSEGGLFIVAQPLDVAGENFGAAALIFEEPLAPRRAALAGDLLDVWCEVLDNYLAAIAQSRHKAKVMRELSAALQSPVLEDGITAALEVLKKAIPFDDLLLAIRHANDRAGVSLHYQVIQDGVVTHSSSRPDMNVDEFIRDHATKLIKGESRALIERFGFERSREEVLISGMQNAQVIGRLCVTCQSGDFNTYDRDILERFADYLRQRVVDFNREWHRLRLTFPPVVVRRLLNEANYESYLTPRVEDVAILYTDISGFTRISEQVLRDPVRIGDLVNEWGRRVVEVIWETGGCFDKMVGDCVIGLWGPPFNEMTPKEACWGAAAAATRIRTLTAELNDGKLFPEFKDMEIPIGVATGVSYAPLCVGTFGPNEDFTGFSSGMNNTARLQGVAVRDEILCSTLFVDAFEEAGAFGEERNAKVKNVADPLRFRALEHGPA